MNKNLGIVYYTDSRENEPIISTCRAQLLKATNLPIVSCSLKPLDLGKNIVLEGRQRSYPTMALQIYTALINSNAKYVFFAEHDVLYSPSHFDFTPEKDDIYYYNVNNWRWLYGHPTAITYSGLTSLSSLCCNRETAIKHYEYRLQVIKEQKLDEVRSREPRWARVFGYEPGTKKRKNGGITNEEHIKRRSEFPNIDIRHGKTFSKPKVDLHSFKHKPEDWYEKPYEEIEPWNLKNLFNL